MTPEEVCVLDFNKAYVIISLGSFILSVCSVLISVKATKNAQGVTELQMFQLLNDAENNVLKSLKKECEDDIRNSIISVLNYYEAICSLYLDNKIDKSYFKSMYKGNLKRIYNDDRYNEIIHEAKEDGHSEVGYEKIEKVVNKWGIKVE